MTPPTSPNPEELILAMLREVLARQAQQMGLAAPESTTAPAPSPPPRVFSQAPPPAPEPQVVPPIPSLPSPTIPTAPADPQPAPLSRAEVEALARFEERAQEAPEASRLTAIMRTVVVGLLVFLVLINLPLFGGTALARALPDRQSLIIRDGLVLKGPGPDIYVIEDNQKRWISSLDAFEHYGFKWDVVHIVDEAFLAQFPDGRPLHVLVKCYNSPHVYRLENNVKRWIEDIPTLLAEGHVWEDVRTVPCDWLRSVPDGAPIPEDAGPPPEP